MAKNTIKLKRYLNIVNEYAAAAAIIPGELIELIAAGTVRAHATEGGNVLPMFALESELEGNGIDDAYAAGDKVQCQVTVRGEEVYAILEDENIVTIGDFLESNGAGELQLHVPDPGSGGEVEYAHPLVGIALEALDLTTSSGEASSEGPGLESSVSPLGFNRRIKIRIL